MTTAEILKANGVEILRDEVVASPVTLYPETRLGRIQVIQVAGKVFTHWFWYINGKFHVLQSFTGIVQGV